MQFYQRRYTEAVYSPDEYIKSNITPLIKSLADIVYDSKTKKEIEKKLNKLFKSLYIEFLFVKDLSPIDIVSASTTNNKTQTITIYLSNNLLQVRETNNMKLFFLELKSKLSHELIHRIQFIKANQSKLNNQKRDIDEREYLSDKHEIMAFAFNTIEYFRMSGIIDKSILQYIKQNNPILNTCFFYKKYMDNFTMEDKELKLYFKYIYMYLDGQAKDI